MQKPSAKMSQKAAAMETAGAAKFKATATHNQDPHFPSPSQYAFHAPDSGQRQHFYGKERSFSPGSRRANTGTLFVAIFPLFLPTFPCCTFRKKNVYWTDNKLERFNGVNRLQDSRY